MTAREQTARQEIARRRALAEGALTTVDDQLRPINPPTPWHEAHRIVRLLLTSWARAEFIAANDPAPVLAVLAAAEATLRRHVHSGGACTWCEGGPWPCPDAGAVLDVYAPGGAS